MLTRLDLVELCSPLYEERKYLPVAGPSVLEAPAQAADPVDHQPPDEVVLDGAV